MAKLILVGVDGSETSMMAGRRAAELARDLGSELYVLVAFHGDETVSYQDGTTTITVSPADAAEQVMEEAVEELKKTLPNVTGGVLYGRPAEVIIDEAERLEANIIVVGNRNMQGVKRVLGSVANSVSHNAPCDVHIVKTT